LNAYHHDQFLLVFSRLVRGFYKKWK